MSDVETNDGDPEIERINHRISRSFLDVVDETWRERGFNSRSEFIRYAMRDAVDHSEGTGFWKNLAISGAQFDDGDGVPSEDVKAPSGETLTEQATRFSIWSRRRASVEEVDAVAVRCSEPVLDAE